MWNNDQENISLNKVDQENEKQFCKSLGNVPDHNHGSLCCQFITFPKMNCCFNETVCDLYFIVIGKVLYDNVPFLCVSLSCLYGQQVYCFQWFMFWGKSFGGHTWQCSDLTSTFLLKYHFQKGSVVSVDCQKPNSGRLSAKQPIML